MVVLKLVQSMTKLIASPPEVFKDQIHEHFRQNGENFYKRIKSWMELSEIDSSQKDDVTTNGESGCLSLKILFLKISLFSYRKRENCKARLSTDSRFKRILFDFSESPRRLLQKV